MDYKVAGTVNGITAIQMDLKIQGIDIDILSKALAQAKEARLIILNKMAQVIDKSKTELSVYAPRIITIKVPSEKVKDVIGPSGKIIKKIIELTGVKIDIEDDGNINISAVDMDACNKAMDMIKEIVQDPEIDKIYRGKVKK